MRVGDRVSGFLLYERPALAARMIAAWRSGRGVVCHALGNLGVETAVGAIEDARAAGLPQAFSSDYPCGENAPFVGIQAAVTRRTRLGEPAGLEEALPVEAALRAYTIDAARAAGLDGDRGSLVSGKRGDLVVLSQNPLECPPEAIKDVQVLQTWVQGVRLTGRSLVNAAGQ